jgi:ER degradation enhancer, mannosidase alpha-like 1
MSVVTVGPHAVRTGQIVYINDSDLVLGDGTHSVDHDSRRYPRHPDIQLRFYLDTMAPMFQGQGGIVESPSEVLITAHTSFFGADLAAFRPPDAEPVRFAHGGGIRVVRDKTNVIGCSPYQRTFDSEAVLVYRGGCTFLEKLVLAKAAGASGVVVISDDELAVNPTSDPEEIAAAGDMNDVALVALKRSAGKLVTSMIDVAEAHGVSAVTLTVDPEGQSATTDTHRLPVVTEKQGREHVDPSRVLYINGHALLNTRLLV